MSHLAQPALVCRLGAGGGAGGGTGGGGGWFGAADGGESGRLLGCGDFLAYLEFAFTINLQRAGYRS